MNKRKVRGQFHNVGQDGKHSAPKKRSPAVQYSTVNRGNAAEWNGRREQGEEVLSNYNWVCDHTRPGSKAEYLKLSPLISRQATKSLTSLRHIIEFPQVKHKSDCHVLSCIQFLDLPRWKPQIIDIIVVYSAQHPCAHSNDSQMLRYKMEHLFKTPHLMEAGGYK